MRTSKLLLLLLAFIAYSSQAFAQETGPGIGIYPTGTETGLGFRTSRTARWVGDIRITRASLFTNPESGSMVNEASLLYRIAFYERVRLHTGIGGRTDWNFARGQDHKYGFVVPVGVEAFPFPFQNAGLFFEAAPFCTFGTHHNNFGIRTVAGFVFYFVRSNKS